MSRTTPGSIGPFSSREQLEHAEVHSGRRMRRVSCGGPHGGGSAGREAVSALCVLRLLGAGGAVDAARTAESVHSNRGIERASASGGSLDRGARVDTEFPVHGYAEQRGCFAKRQLTSAQNALLSRAKLPFFATKRGFLGCAVIVRCAKIRALDSTANVPHESTRVELQTRSFFLPGSSAKGKYRKTGFPTVARPK